LTGTAEKTFKGNVEYWYSVGSKIKGMFDKGM
jgi:hypothetical protein